MTRKIHTGRELDVSFDGEVCQHAARCVGGLPSVFDTAARPWIRPDAASADAVRATVARCPSGARGARTRRDFLTVSSGAATHPLISSSRGLTYMRKPDALTTATRATQRTSGARQRAESRRAM